LIWDIFQIQLTNEVLIRHLGTLWGPPYVLPIHSSKSLRKVAASHFGTS